MLPFIFLFTVVPALELYLLFEIGGEIGGFNTILIIILTGIIGASLAKSQGLSILMKIQQEVDRGGLPGNQIIQGLMVFAGGLLLLTPGFMTDIIGFSLVIPGSRHLLMFWVKKLIEKAMVNGNFKFQSFGTNGRGGFYSYTSTSSSTHTSQGDFFQEKPSSNQQLSPGVFEAEYKEKE